MENRLRLNELRHELRCDEARPALLSLLDLIAGRVYHVVDHRDRRQIRISLLDAAIAFYVFCMAVGAGSGTRAQAIIDQMGAPRRTVRDGLDRLVRFGVLLRDDEGLYYPTSFAAEIANHGFEQMISSLILFDEALNTYRRAIGR